MDFGDLDKRLQAAGVFDRVLSLDERRAEDFPKLMKYKKNHKHIVKHMINRIVFTKKLGRLQENFSDNPVRPPPHDNRSCSGSGNSRWDPNHSIHRYLHSP